MEPSQPLSRRGALVVGLLCMAAGCPPILIATGVMTGNLAPSVPPWVGVAAGLAFVFGGAAVIVGNAVAGGVGPDGDFPPGTPLLVRATQSLLGFCIVGLLLAVSAWVAFGPGERHFSTTVGSFAGSRSVQASERTGRIVFGAGAVAIGIFWVAATIVSVRRLLRAVRQRDREPGMPSLR